MTANGAKVSGHDRRLEAAVRGEDRCPESEVRGEHRGLKPTASVATAYHVWFATKRRKRLLEGDVADTVRQVLPRVAEGRDIALLEYELMPEHVHMLLEADSPAQLSWYMKLLKGRSSYEVFKAYPEIKLDAGTNSLWQDGFGSRIVPSNQIPTVRRYIRTQDERLDGYVR